MTGVIKVWVIVKSNDKFDRMGLEDVDSCGLTAVKPVWVSLQEVMTHLTEEKGGRLPMPDWD